MTVKITLLSKGQQRRFNAKHEIEQANGIEISFFERNQIHTPKSIPQPLCAYCSFHWVEVYRSMEGTEYDAGCQKNVKGYEGISSTAYYNRKNSSYTVDCGAFQPKKDYKERLERHLKEFWRQVVEALQERASSELLYYRYSLRYNDPPVRAYHWKEEDA